jgi:membrane fusion protein (multidrug efflux system)
MHTVIDHRISLWAPLLLFTSIACTPSVQKDLPVSAGTPTAPATTEVVQLQPEKHIKLPGELRPWEKVEIYPRIKGYVKKIWVDRGSLVHKGQLLIQLEAPELLAQQTEALARLKTAEAAFEQGKATFRTSKAFYQRLIQTSRTSGAVSGYELEQAYGRYSGDSAHYEALAQQVEAAKAYFQTKSEEVAYLSIRAPFDGIIIERTISPGALVGPEQTNGQPLLILENNIKLRLTVSVPEVYAYTISPKSKAQFSVSSLPGQTYQAHYARSTGNLARQQVIIAEYDIDNASHFIKAGMIADVRLSLQRSYPTLFVPSEAIVSSSEQVFVIRESEGKAEWVPVQKGFTLDSLTEVFGNLQAGDKIIQTASEEIRNGSHLSHP